MLKYPEFKCWQLWIFATLSELKQTCTIVGLARGPPVWDPCLRDWDRLGGGYRAPHHTPKSSLLLPYNSNSHPGFLAISPSPHPQWWGNWSRTVSKCGPPCPPAPISSSALTTPTSLQQGLCDGERGHKSCFLLLFKKYLRSTITLLPGVVLYIIQMKIWGRTWHDNQKSKEEFPGICFEDR